MKIESILITMIEGGMLLYWIFASLVVLGMLNVPPEYMYSNYKNPLVVAWNWSFFPIDVIFAVTGLIGRFGRLSRPREIFLSVFSLSLMFSAGLMAISFWAINGDFDPFWWVVNLWLLILSSWCLIARFTRQKA